MILGQSADIPSLHGLIRASPLYYQAFLSARHELLSKAIVQELKPSKAFQWFEDITTPLHPKVPHNILYCYKPGFSRGPSSELAILAFDRLYEHLRSKVPATCNAQQVKALRKDL